MHGTEAPSFLGMMLYNPKGSSDKPSFCLSHQWVARKLVCVFVYWKYMQIILGMHVGVGLCYEINSLCTAVCEDE